MNSRQLEKIPSIHTEYITGIWSYAVSFILWMHISLTFRGTHGSTYYFYHPHFKAEDNKTKEHQILESNS